MCWTKEQTIRMVEISSSSNLSRSVDRRDGLRVGGWPDWSEWSHALAGADVLRSALTSGGSGGVTCVKFYPDRHWLNTYEHLVSDCRRSVVDVVSKTNETSTMEFRQKHSLLSWSFFAYSLYSSRWCWFWDVAWAVCQSGCLTHKFDVWLLCWMAYARLNKSPCLSQDFVAQCGATRRGSCSVVQRAEALLMQA